MKSFLGISQIFATLLFNFSPAHCAQASTSLSKNQSKVMTPLLFHEVWGRSLCRTLESMVEVEQEYPGVVEYVFSPGCVLLRRCSGCCSDENLECHPTLTHNVTMQLLRITPSEKTRSYVELSFMEHDTCECRPKRSYLTNKSGRRLGGRARRRKHRKQGKNCGKCVHPRSV
ncbi:snake venom vascular endothelial growth factor toxin ICPP isoform X2 [Alosa sapidissima]|uniref:snake venom vascular endothelial growth factor toxin ICPP isoform X2 n=1 Tax=Alosa sapidissima TaxID=34773 RepID=UPI001C0A254A|nr:snake venom vascular endothelial growth factor toxin ICPP isoform X2 [Alosa sapidissima]